MRQWGTVREGDYNFFYGKGNENHQLGTGVLFCTKLNSVALVRERTIPTERPPPVGEVSANFLRIEGCHVVSATGPHGR